MDSFLFETENTIYTKANLWIFRLTDRGIQLRYVNALVLDSLFGKFRICQLCCAILRDCPLRNVVRYKSFINNIYATKIC